MRFAASSVAAGAFTEMFMHALIQVRSAPARIIQSRTMGGCVSGGVTLAVNGRAGRRVSCVLDATGLSLEVLDMEGEEEEEEEELEAELSIAEG